MANPGCSDGSMQVQRASNNIIESVKFGIHITAGKDGQELVWLVSKISSKCARLSSYNYVLLCSGAKAWVLSP